MGHFGRMLRAIQSANREFALGLGSVLSWPIWLPFILLGSLFGWALHENDLVMLLLTIQTSVDSAATKMLQNHVRKTDEDRDKWIVAMLQDGKKRDRLAAKQLSAVIAAINMQNTLLQKIAKGGAVVERPGKTRGTTRRRRSAKP